MKIGLLLLAAGRQAGGPETYELELVRNLAKLDSRNEYFIYCTEAVAPETIGINQSNVHYRMLKPANRWLGMLFGLPVQLKRDGVDLLHCTYAPPPFIGNYVFTMHCVSNFVHPEYYGRTKVLRLNALHKKGLKRARSIFCVSAFVQQYIVDEFGIDKARTSVIYNGVGPEFRAIDPRRAKEWVARQYGIHRPYILYVGKLQARKNILRLLEAYETFRHTCNSDTLLALVGSKTETSEGIEETIRKSRYSRDIIQLGYTPPPGPGQNSNLPYLYSAARMFTFPSLFEGFGIPLLEAMACGTPVLTSNSTALPEVAGNAAVLVNPLLPESIAAGMQRLDSSTSLRECLVQRGLERAKLFSWENCARHTLAAYEAFNEAA
jgi:glycosyltransferase involved in cell wall biosynthesis